MSSSYLLMPGIFARLQDMHIPSAMKTFIKKYPETLGGIVFSTHATGEQEFLGKTIRYQTHESIPEFIEELF